jgi:hypothetical protein
MPDDTNAWCLRMLRRFREGRLGFGDRRATARFVIDRVDVRVVMPVEPAAIAFDEFTLYVPGESDCDATVLIDPLRIARPEGSEAVDRWSAYHGTAPTAVVWTASRVLGVKCMDDTAEACMDEDALTVPNALGDGEFGIVRAANEDPGLLTRAARAIAGIDLDQAKCVGADPDGIDVRAPFGVVRLEFPYAAADAETARVMLTALLSAGGKA